MKLYQIVFSFTSELEGLFQVAADNEDDARKAILNHPQIKELPNLQIVNLEVLHEDNTQAADISPDRIIN